MGELRPFQESDFAAVRSWFEDPVLDAELGPLDAEWLGAILAEDPPAQFLLVDEGQPIAMIGIARPRRPGDAPTITDVAVPRAHRGRGVGRAVIDALLQQEGEPGVPWSAWVVPENTAALRFFQALGWRVDPEPTDGMIRVTQSCGARQAGVERGPLGRCSG